ncbi:MAG: ScyD/ScyE family protein [Sphaerobacteraceae bacterium]|nr:MAG: ScyD/ScyE family protein [Sphaerobacteraceae bacterium]
MMALLFAIVSFASVGAYHEDEEVQHEFADSRFENRWARTDLPVSTLAVARTWIWGPSPYTEGMMEPYLDSPGGERLVQYFDKSRMELNDPDSDDTSIWTVTQGLLALDMLRGQVQVGDNAFAPHSEGASTENVAGDPGPGNGPTYATMAGLMDAEARAEGAYIVDWLAVDGTITTDNELANYDVTAEYNVQIDWIDHTVASPFWEFMNSSGLIWDGDYSEGKLFQDPFYAVGYPVTEAYWTNVKVAGVDNDVLVQCFERRCLTYTPGNPVGWMVEAGNVGQHYYRWLETHVGPLVPVTLLAEGLVQPRHVTYTQHGLFVAESGDGGDICVTIEEEYDGEIEEFEICAGLSGGITLIDDEGASRVVDNLPSLFFGEDGSGAHDVAFDDEGTMYVVMGFGGPPEDRDLFEDFGEYFATVVRIEEDGTPTIIADLGEYEATENPDGEMLDTNPYAIDFDGESLIVVDAGGNSLLRVDPDDGSIETIAVFEAREALAPPFIGLPEGAMIPMDSVPTDVVVGPDGNYYVSELTGFPFPVGEARVFQVTPDGDVEIYSEGFTMLSAIDFDSDGRLHILEIVAGGFLALDFEAIEVGDFSSAASRIVRIEDDGTHSDLGIPGVYVGTGLAVGAASELYVAHLSITPFAEVVRFGMPAPDVDPDPDPVVQTFSTVMSGDEEVPAVMTSATGSATFVVSQDGNSVSFEVSLENLSNTTMAHIHMAGVGENGPVVAWLYPDSPPAELIPGSFSGVLASGTITAGDLVGPLAGEGINALIDAMIAGNTYVNVHTEAFPAGEVRGQIALDHDH